MPVGLSRVLHNPPRDPQLEVAWESRHRNLVDSLRAALGGPRAPNNFPLGPYFRDSWVRGSLPKKAILASLLWHIVLCAVPFPTLWKQPMRRTELALPRIEITWYGPVHDLPPVEPIGPASKSSKSLRHRGADAYHPRLTIISAPRVPTHPRQTLIRPAAPPKAPKILPQMPNLVQWADGPQPTKPRLAIVLAKFRPKKPAMRPPSDLPVPEAPNLEKQVGDLNIASTKATVPKPLLPVAPASVPREGPRQIGQDAGPAPDVAPNPSGADTTLQRLVAISTSPAPSLERPPLPSGNLAARISISPQGAQPGMPGGLPNGTPGATGSNGRKPVSLGSSRGSGPPGVSITGGNPNATSASSSMGFHAANTYSPGSLPPKSPLPAPMRVASPSRNSPWLGSDHLRAGAPPEEIFAPKRVYTLHVNMPNLASATGSWVLSFAELQQNETPPKTAPSTDLSGPVPLRKVDPKYPPSLASAKVEGEVVLYAVIRKDGSVDSIQLVKGIEPELDTFAMEALARWRFRPAELRGAPVELEAIVHIPFHAVAPSY